MPEVDVLNSMCPAPRDLDPLGRRARLALGVMLPDQHRGIAVARAVIHCAAIVSFPLELSAR